MNVLWYLIALKGFHLFVDEAFAEMISPASPVQRSTSGRRTDGGGF